MKHLIKLLPILLTSLPLTSYEISERGYWIGEVEECHAVDGYLAQALVNFFVEEKAHSVVDFGCGTGAYIRLIQSKNIYVEGYDGNPDTPILTGGIGKVLDLSEPFQLNNQFDWVLSLEVGEHLPQQYEKTFIENLMRHNTQGIVLSWAIKKQGGTGHFNEQDNDYIKAIFAEYGYVNDLEAEQKLRQTTRSWFQKSLMVFRKTPNSRM